MPISYTQSSSSEASFNSGCCEADGDFGIPIRCFCGANMCIQTSVSDTDPGRRFYTCPMKESPGNHIWKWWDIALEEEITKLECRNRELQDRIAYLYQIINLEDNPRRKIAGLEDEIMILNAEIAEIRSAVADPRQVEEFKLMVFGVVVLFMSLVSVVVMSIS